MLGMKAIRHGQVIAESDRTRSWLPSRRMIRSDGSPEHARSGRRARARRQTNEVLRLRAFSARSPGSRAADATKGGLGIMTDSIHSVTMGFALLLLVWPSTASAQTPSASPTVETIPV